LTSSERERRRELDRDVKQLRRANEILKAASAYFARDLHPTRPK
jgi:transposase